MTREETKQLLPIMQAFAEGKTVQVKRETSKDALTENWIDAEGIFLYKDPSCYRIKPEPTYRPFNDAEECWNEMLKHQPFGWMKDKGNEEYELLCLVDDGERAYEKLFQQFTFADGEPFGVKEDKQ